MKDAKMCAGDPHSRVAVTWHMRVDGAPGERQGGGTNKVQGQLSPNPFGAHPPSSMVVERAKGDLVKIGGMGCFLSLCCLATAASHAIKKNECSGAFQAL